jgi:acetoin:2,6-dichlorophenolindophenol oxidoreductase subunit beta
LLKTAIRDDNPVVFVEHKLLYTTKGPVPEEEYTIPFGQAKIRQDGDDVTIIALSSMVNRRP